MQPVGLFGQYKLPDEIKKAFVSGNSEQLAVYFDRNVEIMLLERGDVYSKEQAQLIMKNFFANHVPQSFTIENESSEDSTSYAIALFQTRKNNYRVFIAYRKLDKKTIVNQMVISEVQNE